MKEERERDTNPIMVILREDLRGRSERRRESLASLDPTFGYKSFCLLGSTFVTSHIRLFNSPTASSAHTLTVYSLPLHFTVKVISSSVAADDEAPAIFSLPFLYFCFLFVLCGNLCVKGLSNSTIILLSSCFVLRRKINLSP